MASWEWVYETLDEHGDIVDVDHSTTLDRLPKEGLDVGLCRTTIDGKRCWAYISFVKGEWILPTVAYDAYEVAVCTIPKKYRQHFDRRIKKLTNAVS